MPRPAEDVGELREDVPRGHEQGHGGGGEEEEHRHEQELAAVGVAGTDLELDPGRERARGGQKQSRAHRQGSIRVEDDCHRHGDRQKTGTGEDLAEALASLQRSPRPLSSLPQEEELVVRVKRDPRLRLTVQPISTRVAPQAEPATPSVRRDVPIAGLAGA
jgi:hypothetical protein